MNPTPPLPVRRIRRAGIFALIILGCAVWILKPGQAPQTSSEPGAPASSCPRPAAANTSALKSLAPAEQESLWTALDTARRSISTLTEEEASLPGNEGVSAFSYHSVQDIAARYTTEGVRFTIGSRDERQVAFEYDDGGVVSELSTTGIRAELRHGDDVTEWFENRPEGIEHGFTLKDRPASSGELVELKVKLSGLHAVATGDPATLELHSTDGAPKLNYSGLKAWDADGKELSSSMKPTPEGIELAVNDSGARYPLTVDPLITNLEQALTPPVTGPGEAGDGFGVSVAVDGLFALVGADSDDTPKGKDAGSAYVFAREGSKWVFKSLLRAKNGAAGDAFGRAVALSASGSTALIGAPLDDLSTTAVDAGSAIVFTREGNVWVEVATLSIENRAKGDHFGEVVSLSGTSAAVGTTEKTGGRGAVYVFVRGSSGWQLQRIFTPPEVAGNPPRFGRAISIDGNNLAVGALGTPGAFTNRGSVYLYTRSGTTWTDLPPLTIAANENFGVSVALSGTGLLVGADMGSEAAPGAAYFFTFTENTWTQRARVEALQAKGVDGFGRTVALSGSEAIVGAAKILVNTNSGIRKGAIYSFLRQDSFFIRGSSVSPQGTNASGDTIPVAISGTFGVAAWTAGGTEAGRPSGSAEAFDIISSRWTRRSVLSAGDNALNNRFGYAVDIDGDTCAIGAATDNTAAGMESGSAYIFVRSGPTWVQEAKLSPAGTQNRIHLGAAVALRNGILIAGAPGELDGIGAAYIYGRSNGQWDLHRKIEAGGSGAVNFGASVAINDEADTAVIGAPKPGDFSGSAYVFGRSDQLWTQQAALEGSPPSPADQFGFSVAIEGSTIVVGAPGLNEDPGAAHVFKRRAAEWTHQATLDGNDDRRFGTAVALSGKLALIGAPGSEDNPLLSQPCAAHLFARSGDSWQRVARFTPEDPQTGYRFGQTVAIEGKVALVGAYNGEGYKDGVQVFAREGTEWTRQDRIGEGENYSFAASLALSGDTVIVGSPEMYGINPVDKTMTDLVGKVGLFRLSGSLLSGPDASLFLAFDADDSHGLSATEWLGIYANPPAARKEKLFVKADADASGEVSLDEFIAAKNDPALTRTLEGWTIRAAAFLDLDEIPDGIVTRDEVAAMWRPGTPAKAIDAFWARAKGGAGMDLKAWMGAKILPNFSTYVAAQDTRTERAEVGSDLDSDGDEMISREEFAGLFPPGTPAKSIDAAWRAACATPRKQTPPASIGIQEFVEAPKLPDLPGQ